VAFIRKAPEYKEKRFIFIRKIL